MTVEAALEIALNWDGKEEIKNPTLRRVAELVEKGKISEGMGIVFSEVLGGPDISIGPNAGDE